MKVLPPETNIYEYNHIFVLLLKLNNNLCVKSRQQSQKYSTLNCLSVLSVAILERSSYFAITSPALSYSNSQTLFEKQVNSAL